MKKSFLAFFFLLLWSPAFASPELVQIVTFGWDEDARELKAVSLGSGTIIGPNLILSNKHVVLKDKTNPADFLLVCLSGKKATHSVSCNIPASVTALHDQFDAALIRPIPPARVYFPDIATPVNRLEKGDRVRIEGFPIPVEGLNNFGGTQTMQNIQTWLKEGGTLKTSGDKLTITRGKVRAIGQLQSTQEIYYMTDVKVNFGNSGGAAFDERRKFIGIPTLRDQEYNALILEYEQLKTWIAANKNKKPKVSEILMREYRKKLKAKTSRTTRIKASRATSRATSASMSKSRRRTYRRAKPPTRTSARTKKRKSYTSSSRRSYSRRYTTRTR